MPTQDQKNLYLWQRPGLVDDYFVKESELCSTRTAVLYSAIEKSTKSSVLLWITKNSLVMNPAYGERFVHRLKVIKSLDSSPCNLLMFGVDEVGTGFASLPALGGKIVRLTDNISDSNEAERRFIACLKIIDVLHRGSVVCGDICENSFYYDRDGTIRFIGVMGDTDVSKRLSKDQQYPEFLAPEQCLGTAFDTRADIFALGVLGYKLFSDELPYSKDTSGNYSYEVRYFKSINEYNGNLPAWVDVVLRKCLTPGMNERIRNASNVLSAVSDLKHQNIQQLSTNKSKSSVNNNQEFIFNMSGDESNINSEPKPKNKSSRFLFVLAGLPLFICVIGVVFFLIKKIVFAPEIDGKNTSITDGTHNSDMPDAKIVTFAERKEEVAKYVKSDDPMAHQSLTQIAIEVPNELDRKVVEAGIIDRLKRLNYHLTAEYLRKFFDTYKNSDNNTTYSKVLNAANPSIPNEAKIEQLRKVIQHDPRIGRNLVAVTIFDSIDFVPFSTLAKEVFSDQDSDLEKNQITNPFVILFQDSEIGTLYESLLKDKVEKFTDQEILQTLGELSDVQDSRFSFVTELAIKRKLIDPIRSTYLSIIKENPNLPLDVAEALKHALSDQIIKQDIAVISGWIHKDAIKVLLAICAQSVNPDISGLAIEVLSSKPFNIEPANTLLTWVKNNQFDKRTALSRTVGAFSLLDIISDELLDSAAESLRPYVTGTDLLQKILEKSPIRLISLLVRKYKTTLGLSELLPLLENGDRLMRKSVISALAEYNDVTAQTLIAKYYEKEEDPELRKMYMDTFWLIQERYGK